MCYTIAINKTRAEIENRYGKKFTPKADFRPNYYVSGFSFPGHPIVTASSETIEMFDWGLIPFWLKDSDALKEIRTGTLNARSESIDKKPSFRQAFKSNRCLIPASGFYEWQTRAKEKIPYYIHLKNNAIFSIAGIYDRWEDNTTGKLLNTFSVITTTANPMMEKIHNTKRRMPVILTNEQESHWLDDQISAEQRKKLFEPFPDELLDAYTISKLISKKGVNKNVPELIKPHNYEEPTLF